MPTFDTDGHHHPIDHEVTIMPLDQITEKANDLLNTGKDQA